MFLKVKTPETVLELIANFGPGGEETIPMEAGAGRVLCEDIVSTEDLPGFSRSTMDGFALRSKDSFGATESMPALLEVVGEVVMGSRPTVRVGPGQAVRIATGGMLPEGADAVIMIEYTHPLDDKTIEVTKAVSPLEHVIQADDDIKRGTKVLEKGRRLGPHDLGALAGLGLGRIRVYKRPKAAIISTGDEVVTVDRIPEPGQIRDINSHTLDAFCRYLGAEPLRIGLCTDSFDELKRHVQKGLLEADTVWISGGSSVGTRDLTLDVLGSFEDAEILVHGISISPGKPTIMARVGSQALFGLPGHTASAMVVAEVFLSPFLSRLSGETISANRYFCSVEAELSRNIESVTGRDDYIRVRLHEGEGNRVAEPIFGKSGLISTLVEANGLVRIDRNTEGLYRGQIVSVMVFRP